MNLAFAGAGTISVVHAMAAGATGNGVRAVASRTPERAHERAMQVGADVVAFDALPFGTDAVVVCTPPDRHCVDTIHALRSGAVVMVEKPLASTLLQADEIVEAGGQVLYAENLAFSPLVVQTSEIARQIGSLNFMEFRMLSAQPTWGDFLNPERGGGVLFDLGSHAIALALLLAGPDAPVSVSASLRSSEGIAVDDEAELFLDFASGLRARIEATWTNPDAVWDIQVSSDHGVVRTELLPEPTIEHNGESVTLPSPSADIAPQLEQLGYIEQMRMLGDIVAGASSPIDARFGRRVLDVICAAYFAAGTHQVVPLPFSGSRDSTPHQLWSDTVSE